VKISLERLDYAKAIVGNPQQRANLQAAVESLPNGSQLWAGFEPFLDERKGERNTPAQGKLSPQFNDR
jgi:hypothetical protein